MYVLTRKQAKLQGLSRYFTGKPCNLGHVAQRYVSNCRCVECSLIYKTNYRKNNSSRKEKINNKDNWQEFTFKQAVEKNAIFYAGKKCVKCGKHKRYTNNSECVFCVHIRSLSSEYKQRRKNNYKNNKTLKYKNKIRRQLYLLSHTKEELSLKKKEYTNSYAKYSVYYNKLTLEEKPINDNGFLKVKCAYCGKYFKPLQMHVNKRVQCLKGQAPGEARLYCTQRCKNKCLIYNKKAIINKTKSRPLQKTWVQLLREDRLNNDPILKCDKCGVKETDLEYKLIGHHIIPVKLSPVESVDKDNGMLLCKRCHKLVHKKEGCNFFELKC